MRAKIGMVLMLAALGSFIEIASIASAIVFLIGAVLYLFFD